MLIDREAYTIRQFAFEIMDVHFKGRDLLKDCVKEKFIEGYTRNNGYCWMVSKSTALEFREKMYKDIYPKLLGLEGEHKKVYEGSDSEAQINFSYKIANIKEDWIKTFLETSREKRGGY